MSGHQLPNYPHVEVEVVSVEPDAKRHVIEVMDTITGRGRLVPYLYAEEEARAVLKVIARHKAKLRRDQRKKEKS
jgi:hypothetical protein